MKTTFLGCCLDSTAWSWVARYDRWRVPGRPPTQTWRTFLRNHAHHLLAADLLTVPTLTFKTLYVLVPGHAATQLLSRR